MDDVTPAAPSPLSDHLRTEVDALAAMLPPPHGIPVLPVAADAADEPTPPTARFEPPPLLDAWTARPPGTPPPDAPRPPAAPAA